MLLIHFTHTHERITHFISSDYASFVSFSIWIYYYFLLLFLFSSAKLIHFLFHFFLFCWILSKYCMWNVCALEHAQRNMDFVCVCVSAKIKAHVMLLLCYLVLLTMVIVSDFERNFNLKIEWARLRRNRGAQQATNIFTFIWIWFCLPTSYIYILLCFSVFLFLLLNHHRCHFLLLYVPRFTNRSFVPFDFAVAVDVIQILCAWMINQWNII